MAKLFIGLAIIVTLAAAVLGFLTKGNIDQLQAGLKQEKDINVRTAASLKKSEGETKKAQEELATANTKIEQQTAEISTAKKDADEAKMKLVEAQTAVESATKKIAELEAMKTNTTVEAKPGDDPRIAVLTADLEKAKAELNEKSQMVETLNAHKNDNDAKLAEANKEVERYRAGVTKAGLSGRILAVNPGWNFVVLSVGDRQGAATGGSMIITRGGEAIGRVRITSIEPSTSIADIVPGSVRRGITVQPGDSVVYEGPRTKPGALGATAPAAPAPAQ